MAPLPSAGVLWHPLAFALGFKELGHDVWLFEDSGDYPWGYDPEADAEDPTCLAGARFLARELPAVGLGERWAYRDVPAGAWRGHGDLSIFSEADVFVNVSLTTPRRPEYERVPHRLAIDTDPVFTQVRIARGDPLLAQVPDWHTRLFTFGRPPLPAQAHEWVPTRQPIWRTGWDAAPAPSPDAPLTTVTTWKAYPPVSWEGVEYGAKDRSILSFIDLPARVAPVRLRLAVGAGMDRAYGVSVLQEHGWELADPVAATGSTAAYRGFMADSLGEICFAKHGYVAARSGWFSERSCLYLLTGRPVVAQDTGWTDWLPAGEGLLAFHDMDSAAAAVEAVRADPVRHGLAARKVVEEHFDAADVCQALLDAL
jgi:hypothetical protein